MDVLSLDRVPGIARRLGCLSLVMAAGCAPVFDAPRPTRDEVFVRIRLVDDLPHGKFGVASCVQDFCQVELRRETYPYCLLHELRHPFEGNFHEGRESLEDCHPE